ncbi:hypothetical protein [Candidatus Ichthyocystis sparus]|uniref:hypothetical protein n=1 Tax=Candidatus Ichthyocystis sparus TaxID=1561004 RepID=UPI000B86155A|nr:hypothetical protein [Candidatus Ichthyocystis sparus]
MSLQVGTKGEDVANNNIGNFRPGAQLEDIAEEVAEEPEVQLEDVPEDQGEAAEEPEVQLEDALEDHFEPLEMHWRDARFLGAVVAVPGGPEVHVLRDFADLGVPERVFAQAGRVLMDEGVGMRGVFLEMRLLQWLHGPEPEEEEQFVFVDCTEGG